MINGEAIVSCYLDVASLLVIVLLAVLTGQIRGRKHSARHIYFLLCGTIAFDCVAGFAYHAMLNRTEPWSHTVALIGTSLQQISILGTTWLWLTYVDRQLFEKRKVYGTVRVLRAIPIIFFMVLIVINLFTGVMFTITPENRIGGKLLYYLSVAMELVLFFSSALTVRYYDRQQTKIRFLRITPMLLSVLLSTIPSLFTRYGTLVMGFAIGMTLLGFSMISVHRFVDEESGLYNKGYLAYLFDLALAGKNDTNSVLILETSGNIPAAFEILHDVLHEDGDVIRVEEKKFLLFSREGSRTTIQYVSSLLGEAVEKYNAEHPGEKVQITAHCRMRRADEDPFTFLHTVMDEKEAGDEMKGIVSMISELDQLDKELKLAADIQLSMLPMTFPPFPDRTEFDLYASMTPAKEVGGDFYDFFLVDSDHLALVIADVSGKGIPAALFMMTSKTLIKNQLMTGCDPATALERVNQQLCERNSSMMFVTVWAAVLEISTGRGTACNAGHENPGIRRAGGTFEILQYRHGLFLGVSKKAKYQLREFEMHTDDCIFVYTDGVPEANNAENGMFGEDRLAFALNRMANESPEAIIRHVHDSVDRFANGAPQFDDITMLCLKYHGSQENR